jgi:hypothetical protein
MTDQYDPRRGGGQEYAPQHHPVSRPAPNGFQPGAQAPVPMHAPDYPHAGKAVEDRFAPPPAAPQAVASENSVVLSRAYRAHGEDVRVVAFRKPTTGDLRKCGYPLRNVITPGVGVTAIEELPDTVAKYIALLSVPQLPPSTINDLDLDDFSKCSGVILGFFI